MQAKVNLKNVTKRISLSSTFTEFIGNILTSYEIKLQNSDYLSVFYVDDENDNIAMNNEADYLQALKFLELVKQTTLKVIVELKSDDLLELELVPEIDEKVDEIKTSTCLLAEFENINLETQEQPNINAENNIHCIICKSAENLRKCFCEKLFCLECLKQGKNSDCTTTCYLFKEGGNAISTVYNVSNVKVQGNFEARIHYDKVHWIRTGITFSQEISKNKRDDNSPKCEGSNSDVYYILEDLYQFYSNESGWKNLFENRPRPLKNGDKLTLRYIDGLLSYFLNDDDYIGSVFIENINNAGVYLLVHSRNKNSKAKIDYLVEILN